MKTKIAKCFVSLMFGVDTSDVRVYKDGGIVYTTHKSVSDNSEWECKFKLSSGSVKWGLKSGRWREKNNDIKLSYSYSETEITVTETIGDIVNNKTFK